MHDKLVSIIIPCYNAEQWIAQTLESCFKQTYQLLEIIVVDDGSTDNSGAILETYSDRITLISTPNRGGCAARNRGLEQAQGQYVMFLDADDIILPDTIEVMAAASTNDNTILACRWYDYIYQDEKWGMVEPPIALYPPHNDHLLGWLSGWYLPSCSLLYPHRLVEEIDMWDERLYGNQDGDLAMRALIHGASIQHIASGAALYRRHKKGQVSVSRSQTAQSWKSRVQVIQKIDKLLTNKSLIDTYSLVLGQTYYGLADNGFGIDDETARVCLARAQQLAGDELLTMGSSLHRMLVYLMGLERKTKLARWLAKWHIGTRARLESRAYE